MALDLQHLWAVGEVFSASNANQYIGPPPDLVDVNVFAAAISQTNWDTIANSGTPVMGGTKDSTAAQNAEINFDIILAAGTWTFNLLYHATTNAGIVTVQLAADGSTFISIGLAPYSASGSTIDTYNGSSTFNQRAQLTGIVVATTGRYRLKLLMATKNGSSSNYLGSIQQIQLQRTA